MTVRIAIWSGPRNLSTAMMRSFENRADCAVSDEPLYAHYLQQTRLPHPGADETVTHHETDWRKVVAWLSGPIPEGKQVFYQKQMAHHLLPDIGSDWLDEVTNCFLIREPSDMVTSLIEFIPAPTLRDTGLPQQVEIFDRVRRRTGLTPPVLDARDVLENPQRLLGRLCEAVGVPFTDAMLSWPPGRRATDGVWAKHWYAKVEQTTGFGPFQPKNEPVPDPLQPLLRECRELYEQLYSHRIT